MIKIPIVFSTDHNFVMQTGVSITSLLINSDADEYYDIFILCSGDVSELDRKKLQSISARHKNCNFTFIDLSNQFNNVFEVRNVTKATYYRLKIPLLIPQHEKIIYSDGDVIFQEGLKDVYNENITDYYFAAIPSLGAVTEKKYNSHILGLKLNPNDYVLAGFLLINSAKMRKNDICHKFEIQSNNKYLFQDQDILNIVCKGGIKMLPLKYCFTQGCFYFLFSNNPLHLKRYSEPEIMDAISGGIVHYEGLNKPWHSYCLRHDIWWEYYRRSVFFDGEYYRNNYKIGDDLTLKYLIKMILRYCKTMVNMK